MPLPRTSLALLAALAACGGGGPSCPDGVAPSGGRCTAPAGLTTL